MEPKTCNYVDEFTIFACDYEITELIKKLEEDAN